MLDSWLAVAPGERLLPPVAEVLPNPKTSQDGKVSVLRWMVPLVAAGKAAKCLDSAVRAAVVGALDKSGEVREAGNQLLNQLAEVCGCQSLLSFSCSWPNCLVWRLFVMRVWYDKVRVSNM